MRCGSRGKCPITCTPGRALVLPACENQRVRNSDLHVQPEAEYLGPTPYTSKADSPFDTSAFGFCIEDFENYELNVPGATGNGSVSDWGGLNDSVDADDGVIDGSGTGGRSYFGGDGAGGIVGTDGGYNTSVTFEAFGPDGSSLLGPNGPNPHADGSNFGETAEDRFYGATNPAGISKIVVSSPGGGIEVDHLQLNRCILCGDTNGDLDVNVTDALTLLQVAVGSGPTTACPACDGL